MPNNVLATLLKLYFVYQMKSCKNLLMKSFTLILFFLSMFFVVPFSGTAQSQTSLAAAKAYLKSQANEWGLSEKDISDLGISSYHTDAQGKTRIYFVQRHLGIPVKNAITMVEVQEGKAPFTVAHRFVQNLAEKIPGSSKSAIATPEVLQTIFKDLEIPASKAPGKPFQVDDDGLAYYQIDDWTQNPVTSQLIYYPVTKDEYKLCHEVSIQPIGTAAYWNYEIDATTGKIISKQDQTVYCSFGHPAASGHACYDIRHQAPSPLQHQNTLMEGSYYVLPLPTESPIHGSLATVENPADPDASPFGWHDTDGVDGADVTNTTGNNIFAYLDRDGNSQPDNGGQPDGGNDLIFNFPFDPAAETEPSEYTDASVVNLFYVTNFMHDFAYNYGFDEESGNFQLDNYGNGGPDARDNDWVRARSQFGASIDSTDNASFSPTIDGIPSNLQMYEWTKEGASTKYVQVNAPAAVAGRYDTGTTGFEWGADFRTSPLENVDVVVAEDERNPTSDACSDLINTSEVAGKIVMIDRGTCEFGAKSLRAQEAGAVGVIICNSLSSGTVLMGAGSDGGSVTIPVVSLSRSDCNKLRVTIPEGLNISFNNPNVPGPDRLTSDFDNGIITHEYAHGISNRLVGGSRALCLNGVPNDNPQNEQMGEGWSDFFALVTTVKQGDAGSKSRGIGNYVNRSGIDGTGIRPFPYSTDLSINPATYGLIPEYSVPHGVGFVFCSMLWDMYWNFVERYGWSADIKDMTKGNNIAIKLVMDGMRVTPCQPGFVDGRDAILSQADPKDYDIIWQAFARRGLGYEAEQGDPLNYADGIEDFSMPPELIPTVKIHKSMTPTIDPGDEITVTITVRNDKEEGISSVSVDDDLYQGSNYIAGSVSNGLEATQNGSIITFSIPDIASGDQFEFSYRLSTDPEKFSIRQFFDPIDDPAESQDLWAVDSEIDFDPSDNPRNDWSIKPLGGYTGEYVWHSADTTLESYQTLYNFETIEVTGARPTLKFYHKYETEPGFDGGVVEVSKEFDAVDDNWQPVNDLIIRNGFTAKIAYTTFVKPDFYAFWGSTEGEWIDTYIDITPYANQEFFNVQFSFGSDGAEESDQAIDGWMLDDIEVIEMYAYNGAACVSYNGGDAVCAEAENGGSIVTSQEGIVSVDEITNPLDIKIFPNPTEENVNVIITGKQYSPATLELLSLDGKMLQMRQVFLSGTTQTFGLDLSDYPNGMYMVRAVSGDHTRMVKVSKN